MRNLIYEYQTITLEITRLEERIETIYTKAVTAKIKNISGMPISPGFNTGGLADVFVQIEGLEEQINKYKIKRDRVAEAIETKLDLAGVDGTTRVVFWYREVYGKKWREVSRLTGKSVRQLQRIYQKTIYTSLLL